MSVLGKLIDLEAYPVRDVLDILLLDRNKLYKSKRDNKGISQRSRISKTEEKNIIWATDNYMHLGSAYYDDREIVPEMITGSYAGLIQPRVEKALEAQLARTRRHAEVFTPSWIVNLMGNHLDEVWFGRKDVFNRQEGQSWTPTEGKIEFPKGKKRGWEAYINSRRLEITCGEAPYLVSRYDASTGEIIPIQRRIGLLDRKMRVVNENTTDKQSWWAWTKQAFRTVYGYEYQGDNLLIARVNLLLSFTDYWHERWDTEPTKKELQKIAEIISWSVWQMDGLKRIVPHGVPQEYFEQLSFFDDEPRNDDIPCRFYYCGSPKDKGNTRPFDPEYKGKGKGFMKFDFVIGNPPYQETIDTYNRQAPIYPLFYDEAEKLAERYILISPARFLFNAGLTTKEWNKKMLADPCLKVEKYFPNSSEVFPNTNINGGVAILYRDGTTSGQAIGYFIADDRLRSIAEHFSRSEEQNMSSIIYGGRSDLKFNEKFLEDYPNTQEYILKTIQKKHSDVNKLGPNEEYEIKSSSFERTPYAFHDEMPQDGKEYYRILGIEKGKRVFKWVRKDYLTPRYPDKNNISSYKIMISNADGAAGQIGNPTPARILGKSIVAIPGDSSIPTFMSIGNFDTRKEAENLKKYIETKFVRVLVGVMKITQHITPATWAYVPLQDFSDKSDIDWSKPVSDIDLQLYRKYKFTKEEIDFIETHVKEMA